MEEYRGCRVLVADDDPNVHQSLNAYFKREGYLMLSAYDGEQALRQETEAHPDIIILDIMMPKKDGLQVCREVRKNSNVPIIMLSAKGEEFDKLIGLELGADDYITKPFSPREVVARVKAVLRRMREMHDESRASRVVVDNLEIDMKRVPGEAGWADHPLHAQGNRNHLDAGQESGHGIQPGAPA